MRKKTITIPFIAIIIVVLIAVGVVAFCLYKKNENKKDTPEESKTQEISSTQDNEKTKVEERDLTVEELQEIANYLGIGKTLFLATEYEKPEKAKLYFQIHYGADSDLKKETMTEEEMKKAEINTEVLEFTTISKIKVEDLEKYIKDNLGITLQEWKGKNTSGIDYASSLDAYYYAEPTDAYPLNINIISGKINEDGLYVVNYTDEYKYNWVLTLKKDEDKYIFISNINSAREKISEIEQMQDLKEITVPYNDNENLIMHYKDETLYYVEKIDDNDSIDMYYYDNGVCFAAIYYYGSELEGYYDCSFGNEKIIQIFKSNKTSLE